MLSRTQQKRLLFSALLCLFLSAISFAQSPDSVLKKIPRDMLKLNVAALTAKNVSVQYEYILSKKVSLALGGRTMISTAIPYEDFINKVVGSKDEDTRNIVNISRMSNVAITPEARFYLGKGYGQGFYVAPYYRFMIFWSNTIIVNYTGKTLTMNGDMIANTAGAIVGWQWLIKNRFAIDWWIAGAHYGFANGKFVGAPYAPLTESEQVDIKRRLDGVDIPFVQKTITVNANGVRADFNGPFGGLRTGLVVGIRF